MKTILRCNVSILLVIIIALVKAQEQPQKRKVDDDGSRSKTPSSSTSINEKTTWPITTKTTTTNNIPVFDKNEVSIQFPGEQLMSFISLLFKSTKIVGSVVQNSAERFRTFLRLFKPFFRGVFEIKGLDPVTTPKPKAIKTKTTPAKSINNKI